MSEQIEKVIDALSKVEKNTNQMIVDMIDEMSLEEIIRLFNQETLDFFNTLVKITKQINKEREYGIAAYLALFENAIRINTKLPIDKFSMVILEFAPYIYAEKEDVFLNMDIPDTKLGDGNEFNLIRSKNFKRLWKILDGENKEKVKEQIILMTTYSHAYFYKSILSSR